MLPSKHVHECIRDGDQMPPHAGTGRDLISPDALASAQRGIGPQLPASAAHSNQDPRRTSRQPLPPPSEADREATPSAKQRKQQSLAPEDSRPRGFTDRFADNDIVTGVSGFPLRCDTVAESI